MVDDPGTGEDSRVVEDVLAELLERIRTDHRDGAWVRVHRHADPLVDRHPLAELLALLSE